MRNIFFGALSGILLLSCGGDPSSTKQGSSYRQKKAWDSSHDPFIMDTAALRQFRYTAKFSELPLQGDLDKLPWSDDYWRTTRGGLSYRWFDLNNSERKRFTYNILNQHNLPRDLRILSPSEKFDIYLGRFDFPYTKMERERTGVMNPHNSAQDWEGLCDNWAPATLFFDEPKPVTLKGRTGIEVPFGSSDVKALLIYFLKDADAPVHFLGTRCEVDLEDLQKRYDRRLISRAEYLARLEECSGVNAGSFHIVLANQIGRLKEGFVFDVDESIEVWNQPVTGFTSRVIADRNMKSPGAAPGTVREVEIKTEMRYIEEKDQSWDINSETGLTSMDYHYRVELDARGNIIGGAWIGDRHPDFFWKQDKPTFFDDFEYVRTIYEASVGKKVPEHNLAPSRMRNANRHPESTPQPPEPNRRHRRHGFRLF